MPHLKTTKNYGRHFGTGQKHESAFVLFSFINDFVSAEM